MNIIRTIIILLSLSISFTHANPLKDIASLSSQQENILDSKCPQFTAFGAPISLSKKNTEFICHKGYSLEYDKSAKITMYVNAHITKDMIVDRFVRKNDFRVDPLQDLATRVTPKDYKKDIYDRGHIISADNFTGDKELLSESFLMSNMHHQYISNNRGIWKKLENHERKLIILNGEIFVTTGTIYSKDSKKVGVYHDVTVPDAGYKIIYIPKTDSFESYYVENIEYKSKTDILAFKKSIKEIEKISKSKFNPELKNKSLEK